MQIILLHPRFTKARSVTLGTKNLLLMLLLLVSVIASTRCACASVMASDAPQLWP